MVHDLAAKRLHREQSLQRQLMDEELVHKAVESLFEKHFRLEIVIAGWIDQAVLEFNACLRGDERCLPKMLESLDEYRPDQNGDVCFYVADLDYNDVIATMISFEIGVIDSKAYRRIKRTERGK